jgi:hypothetical protein
MSSFGQTAEQKLRDELESKYLEQVRKLSEK